MPDLTVTAWLAPGGQVSQKAGNATITVVRGERTVVLTVQVGPERLSEWCYAYPDAATALSEAIRVGAAFDEHGSDVAIAEARRCLEDEAVTLFMTEPGDIAGELAELTARLAALDTPAGRAARTTNEGARTVTTTETITGIGEGWWVCVPECNNDPRREGFDPADAAGRVVDEGWDGHTYVCAACGRIFDQRTGEVTGLRKTDAAG
jgi:hypothetical protein